MSKFIMTLFGNEIMENPGDETWFVSFREEQNLPTALADFMLSLHLGTEQYIGPETALMLMIDGERKWFVLKGDHRTEYSAAYDGSSGTMKAVYDRLSKAGHGWAR